VGVKFYLLGGDKGVDHEELGPGRYHIGINEELYLFPTFRQNKTWTDDNREGTNANEGFEFQSKQGLRLTANIGIEYHIAEDHVSKVFQMYKKGVNEITDKVLRNASRNAFNMASSTRKTEEMYGSGKMNFIKEVSKVIKEEAAKKFITVDNIYLIGNIGVPGSVTRALNLKIEATQKAQQRENELRQTQAEAKKQVAKAEGAAKAIILTAQAQAKANKILSNSLTTQFIQYKTLEKWDGKLPTVTGQGGVPLLQLK
jgi:regulator of protease activity HflC (stomatin/prohibitin superfamily)